MAKYRARRPVWISHMGRKMDEGDTLDITWPEGAEPKLGKDSSLELLPDPRVEAKQPPRAVNPSSVA